MSDVSISELIFTMTSVLFLLLGIVLIVSIIMLRANPYDSIAFANVEKLKASINQVCATGNDVSIKFNLPQNKPGITSLFAYLPMWIIRTNGDPNYVLYYESYPPGDAIGWEVYQDMQNRLVTNLPRDYGNGNKSQTDVDEYVDSVRTLWGTQAVQNNAVTLPSKNLEGIVIDNIVLGTGPRSDYYLGASAKEPSDATPVVGIGPENALAEAFKYGKWQRINDRTGAPLQDSNTFIFNNYAGLNSFEKSAIKYGACGVNSLCFKTRGGVYRYHLDQCDIKYIELKYDARNRKAIYGGLGVVVGGVVGAPLLISLAGGGTAAATIGGAVPAGALEITPGVVAATSVASGAVAAESVGAVVEGGTIVGTVSGSSVSLFSSLGSGIWKVLGLIPGARTTVVAVGGIVGSGGITYSAYKFMEFIYGAFLSYKVQDLNIASPCSISQMTIKRIDCNKLECTDFNEYPIYEYGTDGKLHSTQKNHYTCTEKVSNDISVAPSLNKPAGTCIQIVAEEKASDFCWTPDPYRSTFKISDIDTNFVGMFLAINQNINVYNILSNTAYVESSSANAVVLKYYPTGDLESWKDFFQRQLTWAWPG